MSTLKYNGRLLSNTQLLIVHVQKKPVFFLVVVIRVLRTIGAASSKSRQMHPRMLAPSRVGNHATRLQALL